MATPIEDYAVVGDMHTVALIAKDGCCDWFCVPRFDSDAVFAALLGDAENGHWRIGPTASGARVRRSYRPGTIVLDTETTTDSGTIVLTDFMPPDGGRPALVRIVRCTAGSVEVEMDLRFRFDNGTTVPWVQKFGTRLQAIAGPNAMVLDGDVEVEGRGSTTYARFTLHEGEEASFQLRWQPSHLDLEEPRNAREMLGRAEEAWGEWTDRCTYDGAFQRPVERSLITLKALTYRPTGGIVAAGTTSLPEAIGASRNWDYRYCWLRDSTFTLTTLLAAGYHEEASAWREWLLRAIAGDPSKLQIMYGVAGERHLTEQELPWLAGYEGSTPVRVGNGAVDQRQLDVYGEVLDALYMARTSRLDVREGVGAANMKDASWPLQLKLMDYLEGVWDEPDEGLWEVRSGQAHFVHSKVMAWVAADRMIRTLDLFDRPGPRRRWVTLRNKIKKDILAQGFDEKANTFVQSYGSKVVDASALLFPTLGFLDADDPRMLGTVAAIEERLMQDGFVRRYEVGADDGLDGDEATFLMCSFWLVDNYALVGRRTDAHDLFERLLSVRNDVGLYAEEYDPKAGRMLGNFPQAFSHLGLVNSAYLLDGELGGKGIRHPDTAVAVARARQENEDRSHGVLIGADDTESATARRDRVGRERRIADDG